MLMKAYALVLFFTCSLNAQNDSIFINGTQVRIGMRKPDVLALLAERNDLVKTSGNSDAWCVKSKDDHITPPCGGDFIQFVQDKVAVVSRKMGAAHGDEPAAMIAALFSSLDALAKSGRTDLAISTQEFETDDHVRIRVLSLIAGSKEYTFSTQQPIGSQSAATSSVELSESFVPSADRKK